jgi:2,4-dienoyl-CoA reductase-like NADH-dependent reductase (Old Yellow Enzyme family)
LLNRYVRTLRAQETFMSHLLSPLRLRGVTFRNRVFVSPMCQYSADEGVPNDWHLVHLGSRAVGGAGLVIAEATAVSPEGRISPWDTGIWNDAQAEAFARIASFIRAQGAAAGIQVAHAGRKASTDAPWRGGKPLGPHPLAWLPVGPSALAFDAGHPVPREMTHGDIDQVVEDFAAAARRAETAGFNVIEVHAAHGYLLHEFLSPISNGRGDEYGGSFGNRVRLALRVVAAVRAAVPDNLALFVRISGTDWVDGGWDVEQSVELANLLKVAGVDLVDCSSGGNVPRAPIPVEPGYQVPIAQAVRRRAGIATAAVGMIADPQHAEQLLADGQADAVLLARAFLYDPYWPLHAAEALGEAPQWPPQYARVKGPPRRDAAPAGGSVTPAAPTSARTPAPARRS